jgi:hypothetical protein
MTRQLRRKLQRDVLLEEAIRSYVAIDNTMNTNLEENGIGHNHERLVDMNQALLSRIFFRLSLNGVHGEDTNFYACLHFLCELHCGIEE